jgi:hypothetical protein
VQTPFKAKFCHSERLYSPTTLYLTPSHYKSVIPCVFVLLLLCFRAQGELKPETTASYNEYIDAVSAQQVVRDRDSKNYLWIDGDSSRQQAVRQGEIVTERVKVVPVADGMIQHWIAGVFLPGATLDRVEQVDQDYANYAKIYAPDVSRVKVLSHSGDHFVIAYRITKTKVLTAVLDTVHAVDYQRLGPTRLSVRSHSQSVRQVENANKPDETDLPEGAGTGFLWDMDSFWRMEQRDGGVYMECEAITLSRGVPFGMGGLINPILQSFAEESLKKTIAAKKQAIAQGR